MDDGFRHELHKRDAGAVEVDEAHAFLVRRARRIFLEMHARYSDVRERAAFYERVLVLAYLEALGDVRVEVALAVELAVVGELAAKRRADAQDMPHGLAVRYRERPGVRKADGADVYVRVRLVRVIRRIAEHLGPGLEFGVYLKADSRAIHTEKIPQESVKRTRARLALREEFRKRIGEPLEPFGVLYGDGEYFPAGRLGEGVYFRFAFCRRYEVDF